jgi:3'(2'), 5'-bisphosphate nucleotidase
MSADLERLAHAAGTIARDAGAAILEVYQGDFRVEHKGDRSPLTAADLAAHRIIVAALQALTPDWPVLSEESADVPWSVRATWQTYWLVDPLDGTREFVKRNGEFTVNIALIVEHRPLLGVVFAPVLDELYWACDGVGAFVSKGKMMQMPAHTRPRADPLVVAGSRSHGDPRVSAALERLGSHKLQPLGSSLKFCRIAAAAADLYLRYGPTSEWDTAAGQCVLEQAGGAVMDLSGNPLEYNCKESLLNPDFLACGDRTVDWVGLL